MIPQPLTHSSAAVLEFEAFRELLRGYTQSELGRIADSRAGAVMRSRVD